MATLAALLGLVGNALAVDGHGAPIAPCVTDGAAPLVAWSPGLAERATVSACATVELASAPVVATVTDAEGTHTYTPLDDVFGLHVGGTYGFGRIGLGLDLPLWLATSGADRVMNPSSVGDARLYAPIGLVAARPGGVGVDGVIELVLPTGDPELLLGSGGIGGAAHLVVGGRGDRLAGTVDFGVGYGAGGSLLGQDTSLWARLALAGDWRPVPIVAVGGELWFQAAPLSQSSFLASSPGEALLRVGANVGPGLTLSLAGGTAFTPGVGAANLRGYLRLGWTQAPKRSVLAPIEAVVAPTVPGPYDVLLSVRDSAGAPVDATVSWVGPQAPVPTTTGKDGDARSTLTPGAYTLTVSGEGYGTQRRDFEMSADRFRPERVQVILHPTSGEATLALAVEDAEGRRVSGAVVNVDGALYGTTATGGNLEVDGMSTGDHKLTVAHPDFRGHGAVDVEVPQAPGAAARITLERPPGSVHVVTRGKNGPVPDARVRFSGPEELEPKDIGTDGERTFTLLPGHWILVASGQDLGTQEREFEVEAGKTALVVIEVRLNESEAGQSRLVVRVVDPTGEPVEGAEVLVDGVSVGRTANSGSLTLSELRAGDRRVHARADRFRDAAERTATIGAGTRELLIPLAWRPGQLRVIARGVEQAMVDARVRFSGPEELPPTNLGPDGEAWFELAAGVWTLAIASPTYGVQERDVVIKPDDIAVVDIDAGLLTEDGGSVLSLSVYDEAAQPFAGAEVVLDGRSVGTTATAGTIELGSLKSGKHELRCTAEGMKPKVSSVSLGAGRTELDVKLEPLARLVRIVATGPDGPATDALVRGWGAEVLPPVSVDESGRRELRLDTGMWTLVAVSERLGIAERDVDVKKATTALPVELVLRPTAPDRGALLVELVDPAGRPVAGATLRVDGVATPGGAAGIVMLEDRPLGVVKLAAGAPGFRTSETDTVEIVRGMQTRRLRLEWAPRPIDVLVRDGAGRGVDAEVRVFGPGRAEPAQSGSTGARFALRPGTWQIVASAKGFGPWRKDLEVVAGEAAIEVVANLAAERVELTHTSVVIRDQVRFAYDKADIDEASYPLLEQVASTLLLHPEIARIQVQGHTDSRGAEIYNFDLSQRRAEAVRAYLLRRGVEAGRVVAQGYGTARPLGTNDTEAGRARNRRVQFEILPPP